MKKYIGVLAWRGKFQATAGRKFVGYFSTALDGAIARDHYIREKGLERCHRNFSDRELDKLLPDWLAREADIPRNRRGDRRGVHLKKDGQSLQRYFLRLPEDVRKEITALTPDQQREVISLGLAAFHRLQTLEELAREAQELDMGYGE